MAGFKNLNEVAPNEDSSTVEPYRRFSFDLNGPALAGYLRDRLEQQLLDEGKLPQGVTIDTPVEYRDAQGGGEIWVDGDGLPARLTVHLIYPEAATARTSKWTSRRTSPPSRCATPGFRRSSPA